jgi:hypothetical protein
VLLECVIVRTTYREIDLSIPLIVAERKSSGLKFIMPTRHIQFRNCARAPS